MKKLLVLLIITAMVITMAVSTSAIDLPEGDILGHWKLDGDFTNAAGGDAAEQIGYKFGEPLWLFEELAWVEGVDGIALAPDGNDGLKFPVPKDNNLTAMFWMKTNTLPFATPFLWWGVQDQSTANVFGGETWIGIWPGLVSDFADYGPCIGSNDPAGARIGVIATENPYSGAELPWTHLAITIEYNEESNTCKGKLYWNGALVAENEGLPAVWNEEANVYFGVNAWDQTINGYIDDVIIYNNVLSDEDIAGVFAQYTTPSEDIVSVSVGEETEPVETDAPETKAPETDAPETNAPDTEAPGTNAPDTEAPEEKGGCGSVIGGAAIVIAAITATFGCAVIKKK